MTLEDRHSFRSQFLHTNLVRNSVREPPHKAKTQRAGSDKTRTEVDGHDRPLQNPRLKEGTDVKVRNTSSYPFPTQCQE